MLEIILIIVWWRKMGDLIRKKGYRRTLYFQLLVPICWFGGEFFGAMLYATAVSFLAKKESTAGLAMYGAALLCAALFTVILFLVANGFPQNTKVPPPLPPRARAGG
jgi:hypothetical protein